MPKILRTFFIEPELDARLAAQADRDGVPKSELIRRYCLEGLERAVEAELAAPYGDAATSNARAAPVKAGAKKPPVKPARVKATAASARISKR